MNNKKLLKASLLLSPLALVLTGCNTEVLAEDTSDTINEGISNMIPNLYVALAQLGAFIVTVLIVTFFLYKPLKKKMDARKEYIKNNVKESEISKQEANEAKELAQESIRTSRIEANKIVEDAKKEATLEVDKIKEQADKELELKRKQANEDIENRKIQLEKDTHNQIVTTALDASKEILGRELSKEDNDKIVEDFIKKMKEEDNKQ